MTEWPNVPVLKTGDGVTHPRVQISPPPPAMAAKLTYLHLLTSYPRLLETITFSIACTFIPTSPSQLIMLGHDHRTALRITTHLRQGLISWLSERG